MSETWNRFLDLYLRIDSLGFSLDVSRMKFDDQFLEDMKPRIDLAFDQMNELEKGAIANPDENRMVGHYWLRNASLAPSEDLKKAITQTVTDIQGFVEKIHDGTLSTPNGDIFTDVLIVGIGGSALGPQFIADALGSLDDKLEPHFIDNTDPDGIARTLSKLEGNLSTTLTIVISKSGGTKETRNGMLEVAEAYKRADLDYPKYFVAITGDGSNLDKIAESEDWLKRFPMWDWVGGRTSVMSAVGLVPMALQGLDTTAFLEGAKEMDEATRTTYARKNIAMMLALMWYHAGDGKGRKDMVILPYKDRLMLFSKYLQQLVMESLGKELDLDAKTVNQGIAVYGNKGSTDQHAYVQQLRDGVNNFFATFIEVRKDSDLPELQVEPGVTSGDYLQGFLRGTRTALTEGNRENITLSVPDVSAKTVGGLIALYERAVGFYATLVNINAYHQPGVEAGKKAASRLLELQGAILAEMLTQPGKAWAADEIAKACDSSPEDAYHILVHLAHNRDNVELQSGQTPADDRFIHS
ncbi:MAG: glucose-6-phosphate isomerase [Verrucomicrobiota bacterium]